MKTRYIVILDCEGSSYKELPDEEAIERALAFSTAREALEAALNCTVHLQLFEQGEGFPES